MQRTSYTDEFQLWWKTYPLRIEKKAAYAAYKNALTDATPEELLDGARRYADDPNRDSSYTKYPATWLNKGCWEDDPLPARKNRSDGQLGGLDVARQLEQDSLFWAAEANRDSIKQIQGRSGTPHRQEDA